MPSLLEVFEPFTDEEYETSSELLRPLNLKGGGSHRRRLLLQDSSMMQHLEVIRTREHEWTHFRQHISTPHGLFNHRINWFQHQVAHEYFRYVAGTGLPFVAESLKVKAVRADALGKKEEIARLSPWLLCNHMKGYLWGSSSKISDFLDVWNSLAKLMNGLDFSPFNEGLKCAELHSLRDPTLEASPDYHVFIKNVAEGFSKYREFQALRFFVDDDHAARMIVPTIKGTHAWVLAFIQERMGLHSPLHSFCGAILEVAMLCFPDPFLEPEGSVLIWENIHPGMRLEEAMNVQWKGSFPETYSDCYEAALELLGINAERLSRPLKKWANKVKESNSERLTRNDHATSAGQPLSMV